MTPTTPLAGLLVGLLDGLVVVLVVTLVIHLVNRRHRDVPVPAPVVADDQPRGELWDVRVPVAPPELQHVA
jgi:hypothetical protein